MTAIKPINKTKMQAVCKCVNWPATKMDKDGKCHWRIGSKIIDDKKLSTYYGKYYCDEAPKTEENELAAPADLAKFRIPPGLVCKKQQSQSPFGETDRIIGGLTALPNSWPWIVNINFFGYSCGGTIVDDKTVLTAAHCCKDRADSPEFISITVGDHHRWKYDFGEKKFQGNRFRYQMQRTFDTSSKLASVF